MGRHLSSGMMMNCGGAFSALNPPKMVVKVPNDAGSMHDIKMLVIVKKVR